VTVAGVLLAAGGGRRFGGPKALVAHDGELLVERGVGLLADAGCSPVVVVLGARSDEVVARARLDTAETVVNDGWEEGIGSSVRVGLTDAARRPDVEAAVIALVDQPLVTKEVVRRLVDAWRAGSPAAVATFDGEPRTPVVLDRSVWAEVLTMVHGDVGARAWLRSHPELVTELACEDLGSDFDIDTPEDLARLAAGPRGATCD